MTLSGATFEHPREREYLAPGGWWHDKTLASLLSSVPERPDLLVGSRARLSTREVQLRAHSLAGWLAEQGVGRGDPVAWQLPNHPDVVCLYLAAWQVGAVAVPFHQGLTVVEAERVLDQLPRTKVLLASIGMPLASDSRASKRPAVDPLVGLDGPPLTSAEARPSDPAVVLTTSGTSGRPKSVVHPQRTLAHKASQLCALHGTTVTDAVLVPVTLAHMAGLLHGVLHPLGCGVKAVIQDKWDAEDALDAIETEAVTMLFGPPIFSIGVAAAPGFSSERVRSIRLISSGSTPISEAYVDRTRTTYDCIVKRSYGSSEAPLIFNTFPGDPPERGWSTDGRPAPGVEVQIRDVDTSEVLSSGATGEIWVRGPELCDGYLDSEDTTSTFIGGWMRTHDLASIDPQGYLRITGRISSFIIRGGMNISATELQSALTRHPLIQQAVVLGVPDEVYGERVVAFVTASEVVDRDMCAQWFAEIGLAKYKIPDRVVTLAEFPLLPTFQKPDIAKLRSMI